jgi:hypothetical protein
MATFRLPIDSNCAAHWHMGIPEPIDYTRCRLSVSVSSDLHEKIVQVAKVLGLSESGAARHLMLRGLEGMLHLVATTKSADTLQAMFQSVEQELETQNSKPAAGARRRGKVVRVPVTPEQRVKKHPSPPSSLPPTSPPSTLFDLPSGKIVKPR